MRREYDMRLSALMKEAIEELDAVGIKPSDRIRTIKGNSRAKKRLGCCKKVMENGRIFFELEISTRLADEDDSIIKEVILHELLHTCKGCLNHGAKWKALAAQMNKTYGYNITTTYRHEGELKPEDDPAYRYRIKCLSCGGTNYRMKRTRVITHPENYRCSSCGGRLVVEELAGPVRRNKHK